MKQRIALLAAALGLAAAAIGATTHHTAPTDAAPAADTTWGAPAPGDTTWSTPADATQLGDTTW